MSGSTEVPFLAVGNDELGETINAGDMLACERCGQTHEVTASNPAILLFTRCGDNTYLVGIKNRKIKR
jgi:hypothetical protein